MIADITAYYLKGEASGLAVAGSRHVGAISRMINTVSHDINEPVHPRTPEIYVHGTFNSFSNIRNHFNLGHSLQSRVYLVWETETLPDDRTLLLEGIDEIWTASEFSARAIRKHAKVEVIVVPHCVSEFCYAPEVSPTFQFLVPFAYGSRVSRKNPVAAINAFTDAFPERNDVKLVLKVSGLPAFMEQHFSRMLAKDSRITLLNGHVPDMTQLYVQSDCILSTHRGGAFELHLLEAMACGKLVIASRYGGNTDYMTDNNSMLIDGKMVDISDEFFGKGQWFDPSHDHLIQHMRDAVEGNTEEIRKNAFLTALNRYSNDSLLRNTFAQLCA